jgi:hypothetical protein
MSRLLAWLSNPWVRIAAIIARILGEHPGIDPELSCSRASKARTGRTTTSTKSIHGFHAVSGGDLGGEVRTVIGCTAG